MHPSHRNLFCSLLILCLVSPCLPQSTQPDTSQPLASSPTHTPLIELGPNLFQMGHIQLNKTNRTISFPAVVNLTESPVEYLLVASFGKIHESILRTETAPYQIHLAMLLLGAKGAGIDAFPEDLSKPVPGDSLAISLQWVDQGRTNTHAAERVVMDISRQKPMTPRRWAYNGSHLFEGTFLAQQEGSIISLYSDPVALINQSGPDRDNDENWLPNPKSLPAEETPLTVILRLTASSAK